MAELKRYKTTLNGLETEIQLTDKQAEAAGLTGGKSGPAVPERDKTTVNTAAAPADPDAEDAGGVGVKLGQPPANKSRAARKTT